MDNRIGHYLEGHREGMFALLEAMVRINSGSRNKAGVESVGRAAAEALAECGLELETVETRDVGNSLVFRSACPPGGAGRILVVGHMDTVFGVDSDFTDYRDDGIRVNGPGVIDMKGGLVAGIFALRALAAVGRLPHIPLTFVLTGDEEIGSRWSAGLIRNEARRSRCGLVLEAGGPNGEIVTGRKGNLSVRLSVAGTAGHAAFAGSDKASAIQEMAHKILAVEAINDPSAGITANVGTVAGGIGPNTVPAHAEARLDVRFISPADGDRLREHLRRIAAVSVVPGTRAALAFVSGRPPMPASDANHRLFARAAQVAGQLGQIVGEEFRAGVSDANFIAQEGIPVIDGLGPIGGRDHSPDEFLIKTSLPQRTLLLAALLADLGSEGSPVVAESSRHSGSK